MKFKKELGILIEELEAQTCDLKEISFDALSKVNCIFVVQSAGIDIFKEFIWRLRLANPNIYLYVLTKSKEHSEIMNICGSMTEIIEYEHDGNYDLNLLNEDIKHLKSKSIDMCILLFNNKFGIGYENLEEIAINIKDKEYYAFNCYSILYKIESPIMKIQSRKLYNQICNWFWEYIK